MKAFIFDMDGTIFDTEKIYYQTWLDVAKKRNFYFDLDTKKELLGLSNEESIKKMTELFSMDQETARDVRKELYKLRDDIFSKFDKSLKKQGLDELLAYLKKKNKKLALASSSPRSRIEFLLKRENLLEYFDCIIGGDQISKGKPDPEIFEKAMEKLEVKPEETYIIEDSYAGILAANKSKAYSVFIPDLDDRDLIKEMASYTFPNLEEFLTYLVKEDMENEEARKIDKNRPMTFLISCNKCSYDFEVDLDTAFFEDKESRDKIMQGDFAKITCPNCENEFILNYRFVYTDKMRKFMVVNDPNFSERRNQLAFISSLRLLDRLRKEEIKGYKIRMCQKIEETREKIIIFEKGLDDKIIELMKLVMIEASNFDFDKKDIEEIYFQANGKFLFKLKDKALEMDFVEELYQNLEDKYKLYFEENIAQSIDKDWAISFMKDFL
ncbi:MAG: HAD-IA family hydrolase [Peptoniphilaceae bacterium]|nr:HAD-IA family hydrolase [Peptoniphilaceae bacterium]MDY6018835.1 HAD-IA family hydrolase [Anaerococcus sp.]